MKRFIFALLMLFVAEPAWADNDWELLVDDHGAVSMVHVPGSTDWIELVTEPDGSFHTYVFQETSRNDRFVITRDATRQLQFWIPLKGAIRVLFFEESQQPIVWGARFHWETRDLKLDRDPPALAAAPASVWKEAGITIGRDYADHPVPGNQSDA